MPRRLTPEQESVGRDFARALRGAPYIVQKAAYEAGLVEAGLTNPAGGDRDSVGSLQERSHYGSVSRRRNPFLAAQRFRREAEALLHGGFRGKAGDLAAAVQRPAAEFRGRYGQRGGDAAALVKAFAGGGSAGGSSAAPELAPGASAQGSVPQGSEGALPLLQAILGQQQPQVPSGQLTPPAASAQPALPAGAQLPVSGGGPSPQPDISALLAAAQTVGGDVPQAPQQGPVAAGDSGGGGSVGSVRGPTGEPGKVIGTPYSGTHTLGNWQSDNAVDIAVPTGTPMVALQDGEVLKVTRHPQGAGRFAGDQITVRGANGNEYFYAHGVASVKAGQRIRRGDVLGTTGSANGVEHLHFGQMRGDPRKHAR